MASDEPTSLHTRKIFEHCTGVVGRVILGARSMVASQQRTEIHDSIWPEAGDSTDATDKPAHP